MPTAQPVTLSAPSGQRVRGGYFAPGGGGTLTGVAAAAEAVVSGGLSSVAPGTQTTTLTVQAASAGTLPFSATVLPLRGQVPNGSKLISADDPSLDSSVLSRHDDNSAAVMVVASTKAVAAGASTINLQTSTASSTALQPAAISALVSSVLVAFDGGYGTIDLNDFSTPEFIWWQNSATICARFRRMVPTPGGTALEVVADIHAWADRALVEATIENCKMVTATPTAPVAASYSAAVVSVNGSTIATINGNAGPEGTHDRFRAVYARGWVGGDPGLRVTQSHDDLQQHPLLFQCARESTADLSVYAADAYVPWYTGRQRASSMGGSGDHPSIGPLPQWGARALQSGDHRAWNAVEANDLAIVGYNVNYRDSGTGLVPTFTQLAGKSMQSNWPATYLGDGPMGWKDSHHPATGLMGFLSRPSPVFIELAQKVAVWNGTWSTFTSGGPARATGVFVAAYQMRGWAWGMRSLSHATFLTPDGMAWKTAGQASIAANIAHFDEWRTDAKAHLSMMWVNRVGNPISAEAGVSANRVSTKLWQFHWFMSEVAKIANARAAGASNQTALDTFANWLLLHPVKWINEQAATGAWRFVPEMLPLGTAAEVAPAMSTQPDYATLRATWMTGAPSTVAGSIMSPLTDGANTYAGFTADTSGSIGRWATFWTALVAAIERNVPGAAEAWATVNEGATNLSTWLSGFATDPRNGPFPRLLPPPVGLAAGPEVGTLVGDVWTPGYPASAPDGPFNLASWATVPSGRWTSVVGTEMTTLEGPTLAMIPGQGWTASNLRFGNTLDAYSGMAPDLQGLRYWIGASGGHTNGANNGVYRFDGYRMKWAIERPPSNRNEWSAQYRDVQAVNSATGCIESTEALPQQAFGEVGIPDGPSRNHYFDVLFWDKRPTARHLYSGFVYSSQTNELVGLVRQFWKFDLASKDWVYRRRAPGNVDGSELYGIYDEATNEYLFGGAGDGIRASYSYNLTNDTWGTAGGWGPGGTAGGSPWSQFTGADCRVGRKVVFFAPPLQGNGFYPGEYWSYSLDTRALIPGQSGVIQYGGGLTREQFRGTGFPYGLYDGGCAIAYIPSLNRYWLTLHMQGGMRWLQLDPTTTPWTLSPLTFDNAQPVSGLYPYRKLFYMDDLNALLYFSDGFKPAHIFKF